AEAAAWHAPLLARRGADYDPRVRVRIERGARITAQEYVALVKERGRIIKRVDEATTGHDAWLMPTTPIIAPPFSAFTEDAEYARLNVLLLRNCLLVNFLDRCAVTLPMQRPGEAPVGLMLVGAAGEDRRLLGIARSVESELSKLI